jgi:hypothetical protein
MPGQPTIAHGNLLEQMERIVVIKVGQKVEWLRELVAHAERQYLRQP